MITPYTCSSLFLFPFLEIQHSLFGCFHRVNDKWVRSRYVNTYLRDTQVDWGENTIGVVHANFFDKDQKSFEDTLESLVGFTGRYDIVDGHYTVNVFRIPEALEEDYVSFLDGKYSKYTKPAIEMCLEYRPPDLKDGYTYLNNIFTKAPEQRQKIEAKIGQPLLDHEEVFGIWNPDVEILDYDIREKLRKSTSDYGTRSRMEESRILGQDGRTNLGPFSLSPVAE